MKLLGKEIKAVILDMDGTLIDSTSLWQDIDRKFFEKRGMKVPEEYAQHIVHLGLDQAAEYTKKAYGFKESPKEIIEEWHQMSLNIYQNDVELKEGAIALLEYLRTTDVKTAIATANDETLYRPCVERLDIGKYFDFIADVSIVKEGKHSAKIYQYLADKMGTLPENTLVVEDMPTCIKTAHDAGFVTVAIYDKNSSKYDNEKRSNSDLFINSLNELIAALK